MGICCSICLFYKKELPRNPKIQYSTLSENLMETNIDENQYNKEQLTMIICRNAPESPEEKLSHSYEDPAGFSLLYQYDLINKYRVFLEVEAKSYVGCSKQSWEDAANHLLSQKVNPDIVNDINYVMNPYK